VTPPSLLRNWATTSLVLDIKIPAMHPEDIRGEVYFFRVWRLMIKWRGVNGWYNVSLLVFVFLFFLFHTFQLSLYRGVLFLATLICFDWIANSKARQSMQYYFLKYII
jgi:hypothetical protein